MPGKSKAKEPSIDEILDSIRRIIADEDLSVETGNPDLPQPERSNASSSQAIKGDRELAKASPMNSYARPHPTEGGGKYERSGAIQPEQKVTREPRYEPVTPVRASATVVQPPKRETIIRQASRYQAARPAAPSSEAIAEQPKPPAEVKASAQGIDRMSSRVSPPSGQNAIPSYQQTASRAEEARAPLPRRDLLSPAVDAAVTAAFQSLGDLVLPQHERTVEDLVKEILRPMLKEWLDQNLSGIVEQLVRAEIQRVTGNIRSS